MASNDDPFLDFVKVWAWLLDVAVFLQIGDDCRAFGSASRYAVFDAVDELETG